MFHRELSKYFFEQQVIKVDGEIGGYRITKSQELILVRYFLQYHGLSPFERFEFLMPYYYKKIGIYINLETTIFP